MPDPVASHEGEWPKTRDVIAEALSRHAGVRSMFSTVNLAIRVLAGLSEAGLEVVPVQRGAEDTEAIRLRDAFAYLRESIMENPGGEFEHLGDVAAYCREILDAARLDTTKGERE